MASDLCSRDEAVETGSIPLDIDNVHLLLQVEQEQIQKKTFTNWVNAQLAKRRPPCMVVDLFDDFRDGSRLLDLLEVMSGQRLSRERGRGMFQHRINIEKALSFLKQKSIKLVNINIPDIIDGRPSIILGLIWSIILQYHIEELASSLSFSSRQSSMESLVSLDSRSTLSSRSASSCPVPPRGSPLHNRFRVSAKKALLLWVREQCHKAGCTLNVKDFKASWRTGVVFLAILYALRPDVVDLSKARTRSNKQNLEEAFCIAERELRIPRLLDANDVDVRDPDEKSIMTYVAQFLQYSRDLPVAEEDTQTQYLTLPKSPSPVSLPVHYTPAVSASPLRQATPDQKAKEVTCWLVQAYDELLEGWDSTEGESYSERYHVFRTFLVSFSEQRRPIMPLLTAMRRTPNLSEEQRALREAWDALTEKLREYRVQLDLTLPAPLDVVAGWLLKAEEALAEEVGEPQDHGRAADDAREKQELLKVCLEEMPQHVKSFQSFQNLDEYGNMMVPADKMEELKRRFTSVRVSAKYHGIRLEYREHRHTALDLLGQIRIKLQIWRRPYISSEAVRVLLQEWHELVDTQELPSLLETTVHKLKQVSEKYSSKSALAADYPHVSQQVRQLEEDTSALLNEVTAVKGTMGRVLSAWDTYSDGLSSLQAWLEQSSVRHIHGHLAEVTPESIAEWSSRHAHLNEVGSFLLESTEPQTSRNLAEELHRLNTQWTEFITRNTVDNIAEPTGIQARSQDVQALIRESSLLLKEPLEAMAGPLRTYRKRVQFIMRKIKEVDLEALVPSPECSADHLQRLKLAVPEVMQTLLEADQVCAELQHSVSGLDSRLAELLHWETEARELYQVLRASERQQLGQDPRTRALISRGLQLEGQVVTEEQDLQVMVMRSQKNSPIQHLNVSTMHDRVRAAVAQSQEAVGMLSSLGARRDRSRSPPEGHSPSKVFIQAKDKPKHLIESDTRHPVRQPSSVSHGSHETFVPKIVVQEYREGNMTYSQGVMQTMTNSPPPEVEQESPAQKQPQPEEQRFVLQQQPLRQEHFKREVDKELQQQEVAQHFLQEVPKQELPTQAQQRQQKQVEQQLEMHQYQVQQQAVTQIQVETQFKQTREHHKHGLSKEPPVRKLLPSSQTLQSKKAQAINNRPWLQKPASREHKTPDPEQEPAQAQPEAHEKHGQQQKQQQNRAKQLQHLEQHCQERVQHPQQRIKEKHQQEQKQQGQEKQPKKREQLLQQEQQKQPQRSLPPLSQSQLSSDTKAKSRAVTMAQPHQQMKAQNTRQSQTVHSESQAAVQVQVQTSMPHTIIDSQQPPKTLSQTQSRGTEVHPQPRGHPQLQPETCVPAGPQPSVQPQGLVPEPVVAHAQTWAQVRASSPMQASLYGQIQSPSSFHIQLRSHPHSWAPVRAPSPKPKIHTQSETHTQSTVQAEIHGQSKFQAQTFAQPVAQPIHSQPSTQETRPQLVVHPKSHSQPLTQYLTNSQTVVQHSGHISQSQSHTWTQVRPSSSMSIPHQQAAAQPPCYPQGNSQGQSAAQQWIPKQEPQNQAVAQQQHLILQTYPQQIGQGPQVYPTVQAPPQWPQARPQLGPQVGYLGYPCMGHSYTQPQMQTQTQPWAQKQAQQIPQSSTHHHPQIRGYEMFHMQTQQGQVQQQTWAQAPPQHQSQSYPHPQSQQYSQAQYQTQHHPRPQMQTQIPPQSQLSQQRHPQPPSQPQLQTLQQVHPQKHIQTQPHAQSLQPQLNLQFHQPPPEQKQFQVYPKIQSPTQPTDESPDQPKHPAQSAPQAKVQSPSQPVVQLQIQPKLEAQSAIKAEPPSQPKLQAENALLHEVQSPTQTKAQSPPQTAPETQPDPQTLPKPQPSQMNSLPQSLAESPDLCITPPALALAPPQAYTEAYAKAQALARNGFEEAKHCLQEHIQETINIFEDKRISAKQASVKEETLRTLDPELLEEFLRAANGMEAFCTPPQLKDLEFYTQCVKTQWEDVRAEISGLLQQLRFEVTRKVFNAAALQCEQHLRSRSENLAQACISADGSGAEVGQRLEALKELCDTLSPEDSHRLAQTQLRECETRLADIQRQFSGDQDAPLPDSRIAVAFSESLSAQKEPARPSDKPQISAEVTLKTAGPEREVEKQASVEEELTKKEALERYENCKRTLQAQLAKNEQSIKEVLSESVSLKGLHTRLQEIQFLRQDTEALWSEYANQCSQCSQMSRNAGPEQEKAGLQEQWRSQQSSLQRRGSSLGTALRQIDSTENHMVDFSDRLDRYLRQPKDITGFTLANSNILKDIKDLDDNIQSELDQVSRLNPDSSDLDPRDCFPLSREVEAHRSSLDQLRQQVRKSEAAARALDRFLMSLRTVDEDISGVQSAPSHDAQVLQDCRSKLSAIGQSIDSLKEKAPQLDLLLQGARLTVTREGAPASCLDMVTVLLKRLEETGSELARQQEVVQKETQGKSLGLRKRTLLGELRKLQETMEMQGLKEPTMPAVQQRLRALSELEGPFQNQQVELQNLRELHEEQGGGENVFEELESQWKETQRAFSDRKKQCNVLLELLKKFQSCRGHLSSTMQRAEQTISDQASYMGKDNLQRSITRVREIKGELAGLGEHMEEMRGVCRQLQSQLKNFPDCSETNFEAEADALMDAWLDVTEKTEAYIDNLQVGLELWEKQLMLGGEVDGWAVAKLVLFAESHPFHNQQHVADMRDEIRTNEENIKHFHRKSVEIQEMLQSQEALLELQVMETQLRKRIQQVKELFADCTDVFEELITVKTHLAEKIEECQSAVENIQGSLSKVDASQSTVEAQIKDLSDDLEAQEEQAEAVLKEVGLVSSVASPQVMEALSVDCSRLREAIAHTKELIQLKREERDKGLLEVLKDGSQSFERWFQDLQLSVNECFENPESRTDMEIYLQRLAAFIKSQDAERRLEQLKDQLQRGDQPVPPEQLSEVTDWLREQQGEVATFRAHCHNRQKQMESLLSDLNSLQKQHDSFRDWLQTKEKQSAESNRVKLLLKDLQDERAETFAELLASVRRQGIRADGLLKDGDNLIQRYRNLDARLQQQADAQSALEGECDKFNAQAESTRAWISDLLRALADPDTQTQEVKNKAKAILSSRPEGNSKVDDLRRDSELLCKQEELEEGQKQEIQQSVRGVEEQWKSALQAADEALNKAEAEAEADRQFEALRSHSDHVQSWIQQQKKKLMSSGTHVQFEEQLQVAQAVLSSRAEGEAQVIVLRGRAEGLSKLLEPSRVPEPERLVADAEQQWMAVLQAAAHAELRVLSDNFNAHSENTQAWIRARQQELQRVGAHTPPKERSSTAQTILKSKPEGDCRVNNLRRRGQSLCDHLEADEGRKVNTQKAVRDTEEQWRTVLQAATHVEEAAGAEISQRAERRQLELAEFDFHRQDTSHWLTDVQHRVDSLNSQTSAEVRLSSAQAVISSKPEGDSKLLELRRQSQTLCSLGLEEPEIQELQEQVRGAEEQWTNIMQTAKQALDRAERQCALEGQLKDFRALRENIRTWLDDKQQSLLSLDCDADPDRTINTAQTILSCKPEGDSRLSELRRHSLSLWEQPGLEEEVKREAEQEVRDSEEQWRTLLQSAESTLEKAEVQYSVSRELEAFRSQAGSTESWVRELQQQAGSTGSGTQGSRAHIEDRLSTVQAIVDSKSNGEAQLMGLRRRVESLCEQKVLEEDEKVKVQQTVGDVEQQWTRLLQAAEETQRQLTAVVERLQSCQVRRDEAEACLSGLRQQASGLQRVFPWPGLGERRQAAEQAQTLLDQTSGLAPVLSDIRKQAAELFEVTQDPSWSDPSWGAKEEAVPALLKQLTDAAAKLQQGIVTERRCAQLVEQHIAAQDWLRERVKGLTGPPEDREGLHGAVNTLKALLRTVDREQREMRELDSARDSLMSLCTPGGRDALNLEVSHLHQLCATSEQEVRERLAACERRLGELDTQLGRRAQGLKERAAALQWELRSLDQALSFSEPQNNIAQLQQHWHSLQNCEKSLRDLGVKVHDLHLEVKAVPAGDELRAENITVATAVESLCQQHDGLKSRLSEHQNTCSANTARCLMDCLHALQDWNQSKPSHTSSVQVALEAGEKLQVCLREALSHQQFLSECLMPVLFEKLERDGSETLRDADVLKASLNQSLKELEAQSKDELPDVLHDNLQQTSVLAPPRKNKRSSGKKHQVKTPEFTGTAVTDDTEDMEISDVEETDPTKSQITTDVSEQHDSTSQEAQYQMIKLDNPVEPNGSDEVKPAVEESVLMRQVIEQSGDSENTTPVQSRRKSKNLFTDTEAINQPRTVSVEETTNMAAISQDVLDLITTGPVTTDDATELTKTVHETLQSSSTETVTEQVKMMVSEEAELGPTSGEPNSPDESSAPNTETDTEQPHCEYITKLQESQKEAQITQPLETEDHLDVSTALEQLSVERKTSLGQKLVKSSASKFVPELTECDEIMPPKRKSKNSKPPLNQADQQAAQMMEEPESQKSALSLTDHTEIGAIEETKLIPPKRKSKSTDLPLKPAVTEVFQTKGEPDSQKSLTSNNRNVSEETKLVPARRKSKNGNVRSPDEQNEKELNSQASSNTNVVIGTTQSTVVEKTKGKISPTLRKSKGLKNSTELETMKEPGRKKSVEGTEAVSVKETKLIPSRRKSKECLESQKSAETTATTVVERGKLSPPKRKPKAQKLSKDLPTKELDTQNPSPNPNTTEITVVEKGNLLPTIRKSKVVKPTKEETNKSTVLDKSKVSPTKRKSKCIQTKEEPDTQKPASAQGLVKTTTDQLEKDILSPSERQSDGLKLSPDLTAQELTTTSEQSDGLNPSSTSEVVKKTTEITNFEKDTLSPSERQSDGLKLSPELAAPELTTTSEESDGQDPPSTSEVVKTTTEITTLEKDSPSPSEKQSDGLKLSPELTAPELTTTSEDSDGQDPSSTSEVVKTATEITNLEKLSLSPSERQSDGLKLSPELTAPELTTASEESDGQSPSSTSEVVETATEITNLEKNSLSLSERQSDGLKLFPELTATELTTTLEMSDGQDPSSTSEVVKTATEITNLEKDSPSPSERQSDGLKLSPELTAPELTTASEESDCQDPSSSPEVVKTATEITIVEKDTPLPTRKDSKNEEIYTDLEGLKPPFETESTELIQTEEEPETEIPFSSSEAIIDVLEEKRLSPTIRQSEDVKLSSELSTHELIETKQFPDIQKPPPIPEVMTETTEFNFSSAEIQEPEHVVVEEDKDIPSRKESKSDDLPIVTEVTKSLELSTEVSTTELTRNKEGSTPGMATQTDEISVLGKAPSEGLTPFSELSATELPKADEDPDVVKPSAFPEVVAEKIESIYVETEKLSPTKTQLDSLVPELATTELTKLMEEPDNEKSGQVITTTEKSTLSLTNTDETKTTTTQEHAEPFETLIAPKPTDSELQELKNRTKKAPEPNLTQSTETPSLSDYIDKLWKNTDESPKRYLILNVPEGGFTQTSEIMQEQDMMKPNETVNWPEVLETTQDNMAKSDSREPSTVVETAQPSEAVLQISLSEQDTVKAATAQESPQEVKDFEASVIGPQKDSAQPTSPTESLQPHAMEIEFIEISIHEHDIAKQSETEFKNELLKTTQDRPAEAEEYGLLEQHDVPMDERTVRMEIIQKGTEVHILQPDTQETLKEHEIISITITKEPGVDVNMTSIQGDVAPEKDTVKMTMVKVTAKEQDIKEQHPEALTHGAPLKSAIMEEINNEADVHALQPNLPAVQVEEEDLYIIIENEPKIDQVQVGGTEISKTTVDLHAEMAAVETTRVDVEEINAESQKNVAEVDSTHLSTAAQPKDSGTELSEISLSDQDQREQSQTELELKNAQEIAKEVKDHGVQGAEVSLSNMHDVLKSVDQKELMVELGNVFETVTESNDVTTSDVQSDRSTDEATSVESSPESVSESGEAPRAQTEKFTTDAQGSKKEEQEEREKETTPEQDKEKTVKEEIQNVQLPMAMTIKTDNVKPQGTELPQAVEESPSRIIWCEVTLMEGSPSEETKDKSVVKTEELVEVPEESAMGNIFIEVQLLTGTGPNTQLIQGKPLEAAPDTLITAPSDLENCLCRLVSKVLSYKNHPAELSPEAMARQLREAQECQEMAQAQVLMLSQVRGADNKDALELVDDKWGAAVQDSAAVIQSKEDQLQEVTDYCTQTQTVKTTLERLRAELDSVTTLSQERSSSNEVERLSSLQRSMEESRAVLGEMLAIQTQLSPCLSRSERTTMQNNQKNLQEKWKSLEIAVDRTLYHTNIHSCETSRLLSLISSLLKHLETIGNDLEAKCPSDTQWNCKKAQELMVANAEVKAAKQEYLNLQQLSEALLLNSLWENETKEVQQELQRVKDQLNNSEELVSSHTQSSSNPIMEKIIVVMRDGLAWAKQTERDIEGRRKRVALLPEEVHRQLRDLRKLQSEVMAKQGQLESLVEEVTELLPQLDQAEEVPMVRSSLESLQEVSKLTTEKLAKAVREIETGLQTREKLSEEIADLESWVVSHLHREASGSVDDEPRSSADLDRRARQIQETLSVANKQAAVCEALLNKSKDIVSELSITENCQLFNKLNNLREDIQAISIYEAANKKDLDELTQTIDSSKKSLATVEKSLREMLVDLSRHRYPITRESLQALEPFKQMTLEYKSQVDLLQPWTPQENKKELYSFVSELYSKMNTLEMKCRDHEMYLSMRQCVEDLRENVEEQVRQTKENSREQEEKYKLCQTLIIQFPLIRSLSEETNSKLQMISADLYPSQLNAEQRRLKKIEEILDTLEIALYNNLSIVEWNVLKELDLDSEEKVTQAFLRRTQQELQKLPMLEPDEAAIQNGYRRVMTLKKMVESRMRVLEVLEQRKGPRQGGGSKNMMDLKNAVLNECHSQMVNISKARESFRSYTCAVKQAVQFLRDTEGSLLPPQGPAGPCSEQLEKAQQAVDALQRRFQTFVDQLQSQATLLSCLSPQKVEKLQENILSQLLVRMSTLQAKAQIRLESLCRCAEHQRKYTECRDEMAQSVSSAEERLMQVIHQKLACLADCIEQHRRLSALSEEVDSLQACLEELKEWCPELSCSGGREAAVAAVRGRVSRLLRCIRELTTRSKHRIAEWSEITNSVEKASHVLEQVEAELPEDSGVEASTEELQDLLQSWEQFQDRLDCEHRALCALELRTARLLSVPAHLEQAPPTPLCQQLQAMQARYDSMKRRSREGLEAAQTELEEREKVREELHGIQVWLEAADGLLAETEQSGSVQELQVIHSQLCTQKALLQRIMDSLEMKHLDMYSLVPVEIEGQLQEVKDSLQQVEVKLAEAVQRSGPVHKLQVKMSEIQAGLRSVRKRLDERSPTVAEAEDTQKRVWDELDVWHSCLAALEVDIQDSEKPEETLTLTERLVEVQQLHSQLAKQAEQRTTLIGKIHTWLREHQEMIDSSAGWMAEAQSWLDSPCTYTTAKCLSSHAQALQTVLNDSARIRDTLQSFSSVLQEMSQVCDVTTLQEQLVEADHRVADVQERFTAPLSQLQHAATEVETIESELRQMENNVTELKKLLVSPESCPSPGKERFRVVQQRIQSMSKTLIEIQKREAGLSLPNTAEETLTVLAVVEQLQSLLEELEKKFPILFVQNLTPDQIIAPTAEAQLLKSSSMEAEEEVMEQGRIQIAHVEADVLRRSGASLQTTQATPRTPDSTREPVVSIPEEPEAAAAATEGDKQDVEPPTDTTEASWSESKGQSALTAQTVPESTVNTAADADADARTQQKCVVS